MTEARGQLTNPMVSRLLLLCTNFEHYYHRQQYYPALLRLQSLITSMHPSDKPTGFADRVARLIGSYESYDPRRDTSAMSDANALYDRPRYANRRLSMSRRTIWKMYEKTMEKMHEEGYFTAERWTEFHDPSKGRKSK